MGVYDEMKQYEDAKKILSVEFIGDKIKTEITNVDLSEVAYGVHLIINMVTANNYEYEALLKAILITKIGME